MPKVKERAASKLTESKIKAAFSALDKERREDPRVRKARLALAQTHRREGTKLLTSYLKKTGFDFGAYEKIGAHSQTERRRLLKAQQAAAVKGSFSAKKHLLHGIDGWRKTIGQFQDGTLTSDFVPTMVVVDTPFIIWPSNGLELVDSHIQPGNNTAKVVAQWRDSYGYENLRFIFVWENPNDRWAIVNVASTLMLNGECDEFEEGGFLGGSVSNLGVDAFLNVLEWWNQPPTSPFPQATQTQHVVSLAASGGGFLSDLGGGTVKSASVAGNFDLSRRLFLLPPNGVAVFEVTLKFGYENSDGGMVQVNFESGAFQVMCPSVVISILS